MNAEMIATYRFWNRFFNLGDPTALDEIIEPGGYHYNGVLTDGQGLKAWLHQMHSHEIVNVTIEEMVLMDDRHAAGVTLGLYWRSQSRRKDGNGESMRWHGMNILIFNARSRVVHNWNVRGEMRMRL